MAWDSVPWFVGGGAEHSPEVARLLAYAATGGAEGVVSTGDLKVQPLAVPGGSVVVAGGAALILARSVGGDQQTYVARLPDSDTVAIAPTGSSGGRSDLIVAQIEDPFMAGEPWQDPADPAVGPYVFTRVISNVPAGTTRLQNVAGYEGRSAVTLARVDLPASTGTVTSAMIKDLRTLARPRETTLVYADLGSSAGTLSSTDGKLFPPYAPAVTVPEWATHVRVDVSISQLQSAGNSAGYVNVQVRDSAGTTVVVDGDQMAYNVDGATSSRFVHLGTTYGAVTSKRGQVIRPSVYMRKQTSNQANLAYDAYSQMVFRVTFYEKAV